VRDITSFKRPDVHFDPGWFLKDAVQFFADHIFVDYLGARDPSGKTILHLLCGKSIRNKNVIEITKLLKKRKVNLDVVDEDGHTALHLVCKNYRRDDMLIDIIKELINDTDLDKKTEDGSTALLYLCEYCKSDDGLINIIKLFLDSGRVELNAIDFNKKTILHHLCEKYQNSSLVNIVQLLIEKGIDINAKDSYKETAVQHLVQSRYPHADEMNQIIQLFIKRGCKSAELCHEYILNRTENVITLSSILNHPVYIINGERRSILWVNDKIFHAIKARSQHYSRNSSIDPRSLSFLRDLCNIYGEESAIEIIKECIRGGYDFTANRRNFQGDTAVHDLCKCYKKEKLLGILKALFADGGVNVQTKGEDGNTFLHLICKYYNGDNISDILEMLVNSLKTDVLNLWTICPNIGSRAQINITKINLLLNSDKERHV